MQEQFASLAELQVEIVDRHIAVLTMNSPPVNALTRRFHDELVRALDRISELDDLRVVVLTGAGKVFCAGADLKGCADVSKSRATCAPIRAVPARVSTPSGNAPNPWWWRSTARRRDPGWRWWRRATC